LPAWDAPGRCAHAGFEHRFVHILRVHLETSGDLRAGWLRALKDRRIALALRLMHGEPGLHRRKYLDNQLSR
jgi:hypothetical protein